MARYSIHSRPISIALGKSNRNRSPIPSNHHVLRIDFVVLTQYYRKPNWGLVCHLSLCHSTAAPVQDAGEIGFPQFAPDRTGAERCDQDSNGTNHLSRTQPCQVFDSGDAADHLNKRLTTMLDSAPLPLQPPQAPKHYRHLSD